MPLQLLIQHLQPAAIFRRNSFYLILLSSQQHKEAKEEVTTLFPNLKFNICDISEYQKLVNEGNIFVSSFCKNENLLYSNPHVSLPVLLTDKIKKQATEAVENFNYGMYKAKAFFTGAAFYGATEKYTMAAYMLHQASEICLRSVIIAFTGHQTKTHTIEELMQHIKRCAPELSAFFTTTTEEEKRLLDRLEKAYSHARYSNCYKIDKKDVEQLMQQVKNLHITAEQHFNEVMQDYELYNIKKK